MAKDTIANSERPCPAVAMVSVDGGRLQMRSDPSEAAKPQRTRHWRESKVAALETYHSDEHPGIPIPTCPAASSI